MAETFDAIVLGVGGMGSAACWALARRGVKVLGLEQFDVGHARGSSHGESRLIRQAYFEHPDYVPLLKSAYTLWGELEAESGARLFAKTGLVLFGPEDGAIVRGAQMSAELYGIPLETMARGVAAERFPGFAIPPGDIAVYEPSGGLLAVEACVRAMAAAARAHGATIAERVKVVSWSQTSAGVEVRTDGAVYRARKLVVTAGVWAAEFLAKVRGRIDVRRVPVAWFKPRAPLPPRMPCFGFEGPTGFFYGFPPQSARGLKVGLHLPGAPVPEPLALDRTLHAADARPLEAFVRECLPLVSPEISEHTVCMYAMSPDEHFIIDQEGPAVTYAAGFSGHGFKFAAVIGEILADLALDGATKHPIGFLRGRWA